MIDPKDTKINTLTTHINELQGANTPPTTNISRSEGHQGGGKTPKLEEWCTKKKEASLYTMESLGGSAHKCPI